ncbi:LacI family DNA-binding transcriptional regulator [Saccharopolyspora sp. 5N102]|uniref:LacI family DNA-binding transcriptional regulator n=1 Tax=Saccharopolyspora sp. 5N102 TaxID=3375155 RepID=UPI00378841DA
MEIATRRSSRRPGTVSAAAVARAAGVSTAAVSYVMNGKGGVAPETRRHILAVADEIGFRPPNRGKPVDPNRTRVIGLVQPNIINPTYPRFAQSIVSAAAEAGYEVFVATTQDDLRTLGKVSSSLVHRNVDGVVLSAAFREDATALRTLRAARIPYVYLSRRSQYLEGDFVGIDDAAAATSLMEHVLAHGHTDIAAVIGPRFSSASLAREQAFVSTARAHGIDIGGDRKISTELNSDGGRRAAARLFARDDPPSAIVCGSDELAIGILEYAVEHGIRVPEDVAVTGHDGIPHSMSGLIGLTTVMQPHEEMGREAFGMLLKRMEKPSNSYQTLVCAHRLHIGRTCGCEPTRAAEKSRR